MTEIPTRTDPGVTTRRAGLRNITPMALIDYTKLCPKSGHPLTPDEREALRALPRTASATSKIRCDACGHLVDACPHPGTGRSLIYAMHLKSLPQACPDADTCCAGGAS